MSRELLELTVAEAARRIAAGELGPPSTPRPGARLPPATS